MAAHHLCVPLSVTHGVQHAATHLQDALQRGRPGGFPSWYRNTDAAGTATLIWLPFSTQDVRVTVTVTSNNSAVVCPVSFQVKRTLFVNGISKYAEEKHIKQHFE